MALPDAMFLAADQPDQPMRIGGLLVFAGSGATDLEERLVARALTPAPVSGPLGRAVGPRSLAAPWGTWREVSAAWEEHVFIHPLVGASDDDLLEVVAGLHGRRLARDRPLWEAHFFTGLADGGFAVYYAVHHSILDGVQALRMATRKRGSDLLLPWEEGASSDRRRESVAGIADRRPSAGSALRAVLSLWAAGRPRRQRRTSWPRRVTARRAVSLVDVDLLSTGAAARQGVTSNDVLLSRVAEALAALDRGEYPEQRVSRRAMVPVALTSSKVGGNIAGASVCDLGTELACEDRLTHIAQQTRARVHAFRAMPVSVALAVSAVVMLRQLANCLSRRGALLYPGFDLVVSNLGVVDAGLSLEGARLRRIVPLSVLGNGQPLNVTAVSYGGLCTAALLYDPGAVDGARLAGLLREASRVPA